jgi:hypothetical protein
MSEEVEESDGVIYSAEEARWNEFRLLHEQETGLIADVDKGDLLLTSAGVVLGLADVRSQCLWMKRGISLNALKRCILIWALWGC